MELLNNVEDPRDPTKITYPLINLLFIGLCAVFCGAETWEDMEIYAEARFSWLSKYIDLSAGTPPWWTIRRIFSLVNPDHIANLTIEVAQFLAGDKVKDHIALDGKASRGNKSIKKGIKPLQMVSAWCEDLGLSLAEVAVANKSNEITAIPKLLDLLDVKGCTISIDAMGCQTEIADKIVERGGEYVLALKGNQGKLHQEVEAYMQAEGISLNNLVSDYFDESHGRVTRRRYFACTASKLSDHYFSQLNTIIATETISDRGSGVTAEWRYYISSHKADNEKLPEYIRGHWSIENKLHWILDVHLGDDADKKLEKNAVEILSRLRRMVINMVKSKPPEGKKRSTRSQLKRLVWDNDYLLSVLLQ